MQHANMQIEKLFKDTEYANRFDMSEYKLLTDQGVAEVSLSKVLRSSCPSNSTKGMGIKSFQDKLLTTYGL